MGTSSEYIAWIKPVAFRDDNFKKTIRDMKLGKTGYLFMLDEKGTLVACSQAGIMKKEMRVFIV